MTGRDWDHLPRAEDLLDKLPEFYPPIEDTPAAIDAEENQKRLEVLTEVCEILQSLRDDQRRRVVGALFEFYK